MNYERRWKIVQELGAGGQGTVHLVHDLHGTKEMQVTSDILDAFKRLGPHISSDVARREGAQKIREAILEVVNAEAVDYRGALKVLHKPEHARDPERAAQRLRREIKAMSEASHNHLLRILDSDLEELWYVSEYHARGSMGDPPGLFKGDFLAALQALRPLVEGVATLHAAGLIHRDIKPDNVFLSAEGDLVLGDFGLVFFMHDIDARLSATFDNVGSSAWMPPWAMLRRVEEIKPTFDVFSLGKLLWSMVSGQPTLPFWYFEKPQFNVEKLFPDCALMRFANPLFRKCIVEEEDDCLPDAGALLEEIDLTLARMDAGAAVIGDDIVRPCQACGTGKYILTVNQDVDDMRSFCLSPASGRSFKIFVCDNCGHVQFFAFGDGTDLPAWKQ